MYELKKIGKVFTSKFVGTGPSSYKKRIYRAAVSQRLRNSVLSSLNYEHNVVYSSENTVHITRLHDATCQNTTVLIFNAVTCLNNLQITDFSTLSLVILSTGLYPSPNEYIIINTATFNSYCNVILPSTTRSSNWCPLCRFTDCNFILFISPIRAVYPACLIYLHVIDFLIFCAEYINHSIIKLLTAQISLHSCHFLLFRLKRCSRLPVIKHSYSVLFA